MKLPSRFQPGDPVRVGRQTGTIHSVTFGPGKVTYCVETRNGIIGPLDSLDVHPPLRVIVLN